MERLFRIANLYCLRTNYYPIKRYKKDPETYTFFISLLLFSICVYSSLKNIGTEDYLSFMIWSILFEFGWIASSIGIAKNKNNYILSKLNKKFRQNFKNTKQLKKFLLKAYFPKYADNYLDLLDEIDKLTITYKNNIPNVEEKPFPLQKIIYDPEGKARFYVLCGALITLLSTLFFKLPADENQIGGTIEFIFSKEGMSFYLYITFIFFLILSGLAYIWCKLPTIGNRITIGLTKKSEKNIDNITYLKHDLILYSNLKILVKKTSIAYTAPARRRPQRSEAAAGRGRETGL